jgi:hypothetical protein
MCIRDHFKQQDAEIQYYEGRETCVFISAESLLFFGQHYQLLNEGRVSLISSLN